MRHFYVDEHRQPQRDPVIDDEGDPVLDDEGAPTYTEWESISPAMLGTDGPVCGASVPWATFDYDEDLGRFLVSVPVSRIRLHGCTIKDGKRGRKRGAGLVMIGGPPTLGEALMAPNGRAHIVTDVPDCPGDCIDVCVVSGEFPKSGTVYAMTSGASIKYEYTEQVATEWEPCASWDKVQHAR